MHSIRERHGLARNATIAIVVVVIIIAAAGIVALTQPGKSTTSATSSQSTSSSSITSQAESTTSSVSTSTSVTPKSSTLTWETVSTPAVLDPGVGGLVYDLNIQQNVYEPLLWFSGANSTNVIPWLAQSYSVSSDGLSVSFTLRQGITFADGEPLNSSAVYFSLNRLLIIDGTFGPDRPRDCTSVDCPTVAEHKPQF